MLRDPIVTNTVLLCSATWSRPLCCLELPSCPTISSLAALQSQSTISAAVQSASTWFMYRFCCWFGGTSIFIDWATLGMHLHRSGHLQRPPPQSGLNLGTRSCMHSPLSHLNIFCSVCLTPHFLLGTQNSEPPRKEHIHPSQKKKSLPSVGIVASGVLGGSAFFKKKYISKKRRGEVPSWGSPGQTRDPPPPPRFWDPGGGEKPLLGRGPPRCLSAPFLP